MAAAVEARTSHRAIRVRVAPAPASSSLSRQVHDSASRRKIPCHASSSKQIPWRSASGHTVPLRSASELSRLHLKRPVCRVCLDAQDAIFFFPDVEPVVVLWRAHAVLSSIRIVLMELSVCSLIGRFVRM